MLRSGDIYLIEDQLERDDRAVITTSSPFSIKRYIALELRRHRESAGLKQQDVADAIGITRGNVSHLEKMRHLPKQPELMAMLNLYGRPELIDTFIELVKAARKPNPWAHITSNIKDFELFVGYEQGATGIEKFDALCVPGLLQTRAYATAVLQASVPQLEDEQVARFVEQRMDRQGILEHADPPAMWFVITEGVLRCNVGGRDVMAAQCAHLIEIANRPSVQLQVLPADTGAHGAMQSPFTIFEFPTPSAPRVAYTETSVMGHCYEEPEQVTKFTAVFNSLRVTCLNPARSIALIDKLRREA
jgi:transcriptional regulator with XRE-family HTH domain